MKVYIEHRHAKKPGYATGCMKVSVIDEKGIELISFAYPANNERLKAIAVREMNCWVKLNCGYNNSPTCVMVLE